MASKENLKNFTLMGAVEAGSIPAVRMLLKEGANPNYSPKWVEQSLLLLAVKKKHVKIIELLLQYKAKVDDNFLREISKYGYEDILEKVSVAILKYNRNNITLMENMFSNLVNYARNTKVLELLLNHGLPIDHYIGESYRERGTLLHSAIKSSNMDYITLLIERGADINKKTLYNNSCLWLAVEKENEPMAKMLLKKGADVNERNGKDLQTVIFKVSSNGFLIGTLLEHGSDLNILDKNNITPLLSCQSYNTQKKCLLTMELAKLKLENKEIYPKNLEFIENDSYLKTIFQKSLTELQKMKGEEIYNGLSFYDILAMRKHMKKLVLLTRKEDFMQVLESSEYLSKKPMYSEEFRKLIKEAKNRRDVIDAEEKKIRESKLDQAFLLPLEIMDMIVEFAIDHLYFERGWTIIKDPDAEFGSEDEDEDDDYYESDEYGMMYDNYDDYSDFKDSYASDDSEKSESEFEDD